MTFTYPNYYVYCHYWNENDIIIIKKLYLRTPETHYLSILGVDQYLRMCGRGQGRHPSPP